MYCSSCGKSDQQKNTYCRNCGEFLPDLSDKKKSLTFGGNTPEEQINTNLFLNLMSAVVSFALAIALYVTFLGQDALPIIYLTAAFLLVISGWQFSTFYIGTKLKKNFSRRRENLNLENQTATETSLASAQTKVLLNEANFENIVPTSVTEKTTKDLTEKVKINSSQAKH